MGESLLSAQPGALQQWPTAQHLRTIAAFLIENEEKREVDSDWEVWGLSRKSKVGETASQL